MQVLKVILIIADIILALAVIILVMIQNKDDQGLSGTITGAAANNFLDKNKGRTREGKLKYLDSKAIEIEMRATKEAWHKMIEIAENGEEAEKYL